MKIRPIAGIGFGQTGYWGNRHFSTMELADKAFTAHIEQVADLYRKSFRDGFVVKQDSTSSLIKLCTLTNVKKNGRLGKIVHTVTLYKIDEPMADRFLDNPGYRVEA